MGGCGERPREEKKPSSLREALQETDLPPLKDDLPDKGDREAARGGLPELEELEIKSPEVPEEFGELPDFAAIGDVKEKKRRFFEYMGTLLRAENARIRSERFRLVKMYDAFLRGEAPQDQDRAWLKRMCRKYRVSFDDGVDAELFRDLLVKVDVVPVDLGVAQAANESAWGTSRFARVGNNLFGQWCFEQGCGLVPLRRSPGSTHEVKTYASPRLSVRDYLRNLNSHPAYSEFRDMRYRQRRSDEDLDGSRLAEGLQAYSGIGEEYILRLRGIVDQYAAYREKMTAESGDERG